MNIYHISYTQKFIHWKMIMVYLIVILGLSIVLTTPIGPAYRMIQAEH